MEVLNPSTSIKHGWSLYRLSHLVKVPLLLIKSCAGSIGPLHVKHEVLNLILEPLLGLLKGGAFGVHSFHVFLSSLQTLGQFLP